MQKYKFIVYIGQEMVMGQGDEVIAIADPQFHVPNGDCTLSGGDKIFDNRAFFKNLSDLGTYFADYLDTYDNEKQIIAEIVLNIQSLRKTFVGQAVVKIVDEIGKFRDYKSLRFFPKI